MDAVRIVPDVSSSISASSSQQQDISPWLFDEPPSSSAATAAPSHHKSLSSSAAGARRATSSSMLLDPAASRASTSASAAAAAATRPITPPRAASIAGVPSAGAGRGPATPSAHAGSSGSFFPDPASSHSASATATGSGAWSHTTESASTSSSFSASYLPGLGPAPGAAASSSSTAGSAFLPPAAARTTSPDSRANASSITLGLDAFSLRPASSGNTGTGTASVSALHLPVTASPRLGGGGGGNASPNPSPSPLPHDLASASTATLPSTAGPSSKRSKNPFHFLKKKGSSVLNPKDHASSSSSPTGPSSIGAGAGSRLLGPARDVFHSRGPSGSHHHAQPSPDSRLADLPHAPSSVSLASSHAGSLSTVLGSTSSPKPAGSHAFLQASGSGAGAAGASSTAGTDKGHGAGGGSASHGSSGISALQAPFSLSSVYNRLHPGHSSSGSSGETSSSAAASGGGTHHVVPSSRHAPHSNPSHHSFLHLHLGSIGHHSPLSSHLGASSGANSSSSAAAGGPGSSHAAAAAAAAASASAIGLDEEHLLEPAPSAAGPSSSSKSGEGGGRSHRPGRLRLGRPRTRDKEQAQTGSSVPSTGGATAGTGGGTGQHEDDLHAFAAALGERYGEHAATSGTTTTAGGAYQLPAGSAAFPFGPATPSAEIDFSLDTNLDEIDDIVDREAARRARALGVMAVMPDIGGVGGGGGVDGEGGEAGEGEGRAELGGGGGAGSGGLSSSNGGRGGAGVGGMASYYDADGDVVMGTGGAMPLPKPLPSQLQSAADDKEAAERAARAAMMGGGSSGSPTSAGLGLSPRTSGGGASRLGSLSGAAAMGPSGSGSTSSGSFHAPFAVTSLLGLGRDSGSSSVGTSALPIGPGGFVSGPGSGSGTSPASRPASSLEARGRSSSVSFLEAAGLAMGGGGSSMARLGSFTGFGSGQPATVAASGGGGGGSGGANGGRSLGSVGNASMSSAGQSGMGADSVAKASTRNYSVAAQDGGNGSTSTGNGASSAGISPQHPKLLRLHSGPAVPTQGGMAGFASARAGVRRVSLADGPMQAGGGRYGVSYRGDLSTLAGSIGSSSYGPGSSTTTAVTGLDSRSSVESSKGGYHPGSGANLSGSLLFERATGGSMPLESLREFEGVGSSRASADALERQRMAQMLALRKGSATSAGSRRSGISPKSSYANLPHVSREGPSASGNGNGNGNNNGSGNNGSGMGGWNLPSLAAGLADPSYKFPARLGSLGTGAGAKQDGGMGGDATGSSRKMSGTAPSQAPPITARGAPPPTTAWMAPDSWAVQPDASRAELGADDDSEESEGEASHLAGTAGPSGVSGKFDWSNAGSASGGAGGVGGGSGQAGGAGAGSTSSRRRRSSSAISYSTNGAAGGDGPDGPRPGTGEASLHAPSLYFGEGRWGQRKDSAGTEPGYSGSPSARRPSDIEILETNDSYDGAGTGGGAGGGGGFGTGANGEMLVLGPDQVTPTSPTSVFLQQQQSQSSLGGGGVGGGGTSAGAPSSAASVSKTDYAPSISSHSHSHSTHTTGRGGGGAASVSSGAAAVAVAAAGKFLHRPHKHKSARPSTAGSLHSTFRSQMAAAAAAAAAGGGGGPATPSSSANVGSPAPAHAHVGAGAGAGSTVNNGSHAQSVDGGSALGLDGSALNGPMSAHGGAFGPRPGSGHRPSVGGSSEDGGAVHAAAAMASAGAFVRERESSGYLGRRPNTAMSQGGVSLTGSLLRQQPHCVRIHRTDGPPFTILCPLYSTAAEIRAMISKKFGGADAAAYRLFVRDKGSERPLGPSEKPALIQKRRLEQAGYNETDGLENMGRSDLSYLLRFVWRLDSVPTFDSESFGNDEHTFQHLHLQGRNLEMVPIFLYRHADWIVSLDLSGNPMSDVPLDFIQACTNLRSIRLCNLALKRVPQSLRQSETLTYIDVSNNRIPDLSHIALDNAAELVSFKVQNNRLTELPSYFARIHTLRYLNISNNRFETFPPVLCEMPLLVDLDVSFNAISSLPHDIDKMVKLQRLVLVGNALESLPPTMSELVSLESIDVRRNLLQDVSVLFRLPNLQSLLFSHNNLKNVSAEFGAKLRTLDFGQNQLTKIKIVVPAASELTVLNLTSADIDKFDDSLFSQLPNLTDLVLDRNRQFSDLTEAVGDLRSLVRLSCNNTRLAKLPDAIGKLSKLRVLEVHNNNIKVIPASIWNCGELEYINVSANIVQSFPFPPTSGSLDGGGGGGESKAVVPAALNSASPTVVQERKGSGASFTTTPWATGAAAAPLSVSLKKLRLCDNRLTDDVFNVLTRFVCLEVLNLSFNEIYEVPAGRLSKNLRLQELYLSGNNLSSLPTEDIAQLRDLQTLYINGNKLQTLPAELGQLRKLVNLDVGNNNLKYNIANWNYDWNWNSNVELRFLNLSGNKRLEIKYKTEMVNGRQKNISDFSRLTNLRLLGLMDVTFTVQSTPDESDNRRVRTSLSQINEMSYGIADTLGKHDSLSIVDVVIPQFRKRPNECLFGLFAGRGHGSLVGSRIANHLAEWVGPRVEWEHKRMSSSGEPRAMQDVLRRAFLRINKELADMLMSEGLRQDSEVARVDDGKPAVSAAMGSSARHHWSAGASAVLAYMVDKTLYVANAGDALAVISRNRGDAHLISTKHDPSARDEAMRIRSAEGWVSLRGYVNDRIDVSRSFGYYHLFPIVNAAPAVQTIELTDSDEFIILANRTLWDYMSYQTAVDVSRMEHDDPMLAAQKLRDFAISFGAEESIMVMVISVADLFYDRQQRRAATNDLLVEKYERPRFRRDLPGDRVLARLPMEIPAPIGQLALVFTDIKNSTYLWDTNPGMHAAIRLHTSLLRRQLHIIGGYEVKTEGDAFMVSFPTISSAMHWCFTIQLQLLREDWPQEILECEDGKEVYDSNGELIYRGLSVRMGIHWGAPVCELDPVSNRMDYFGPIVNRAARISGAADGGQIMASKDVVAELKAMLDTGEEDSENSTPSGGEGDAAMNSYRLLQPGANRDVVQLRRLGFGISEVGERKLKGLETPEMLYLVYPTALAGRLEAKPDAPAPQVFEPTVQLLNVDEIKQLGALCLRLEALSAGHVFPGIGEAGAEEALTAAAAAATTAANTPAATTPMKEVPAIAPIAPLHDGASQANGTSALGAPRSPGLSASEEGDDDAASGLQNSTHTLVPLGSGHQHAATTPTADSRLKVVEAALTLHPELLVYALRDDATDEEMARILEQLTTRISNALSSLVLQRVGVAHGQELGLDAVTQRLLASLLRV